MVHTPENIQKAEEVVAAYMNHIYCVCGVFQRQYCRNHGSEFKNSMLTRGFSNVLKLNIGNQSLSDSPGYCNGRIEGISHVF